MPGPPAAREDIGIGALGIDDDVGQAPAADLLFGIAALMIATLAVLLHGFGAATTRPPSPDPVAALIAAADPVLALLAGPDGVEMVDRRRDPPVRTLMATADLLADPALPALLEQARSAGGPVLVVIADHGEEAAFVLEGLAARHGPAVVLQARLAASGAGR